VTEGAQVIASAGKRTLRKTLTSASYLSQDGRRVHLGLGPASRLDRLEVRWPGGGSESWDNIEADRIWDVRQGERGVTAFGEAGPVRLSKDQLVQFWAKQRAAMDAMKVDRNLSRAAALFREALAIDPAHEDSRYYLANCLVAEGDLAGAIAELERLARINPLSHRAWQRRGGLLAAMGQYPAAQESLDRALQINPEETGTLLLLAEVALARGDLKEADRRLGLALQMNPRAVGGLFLQGYVAWQRHDSKQAAVLLASAQKARGPDWKPRGSVAEGDVRKRMDVEAGFLTRYWESWDGRPDPALAYGELQRRLATPRSSLQRPVK
jgi:tetratricopeptide (TPR) repeat protein